MGYAYMVLGLCAHSAWLICTWHIGIDYVCMACGLCIHGVCVRCMWRVFYMYTVRSSCVLSMACVPCVHGEDEKAFLCVDVLACRARGTNGRGKKER